MSGVGQVEKSLDQLTEEMEKTVIDTIDNELAELSSELQRLPTTEEPPRTTVEIQGDASAEKAWQNYLVYFLDPQAPHGLGTDALNKFLQGIGRHAEGVLPDHASENAIIEKEEQSDAGNRFDLVIHDEERFIIGCELKLYSSEGDRQTIRYVEDDQIGQISKDVLPDERQHYVYLKRSSQDDAAASEFVNISWEELKEWLTPLLLEGRGRYPSRTTAQLNDFLDTIQRAVTDDEHLQIQRKKMNLFFEHQESIQEAEGGLEEVHDYEEHNWRRRFIEGFLPETWSEEWRCNDNAFGQFYHFNWRPNVDLNESEDRIKLWSVHLIRHIESFKEGKLTVQLRWPGESRYRSKFKDLFVSDRFSEKLVSALAANDIRKRADYSYNNPRFTEKVYSVDRMGLPDSYYETLSRAVEEHQQVEPVLTEILLEAVAEVEEET